MSVLTQPAPRNARETSGFAGGIAALAKGKLYALQNPFALDGRVSSYPASARGYSVANSYLLTQSDAAMLIDTGFGKDEPVIRAQIESLIAPGLPLSMFPLRLNEFMSINNVESFRRAFQRRDLLHQQCRRGAVVRFRRQGERPQRARIDEGHRGDPRRHHPARQERPGDRRHAGADPPDRHALALRPRHRARCSPPTCSPMSGATARTDRGSSPTPTTTDLRARLALVHAQHALLVAGGRADRLDPPRHRRGVRQIRHRDHRARLRLHPARPQGRGAALRDAR